MARRVTVVLAELSYRLVEHPIRRGGALARWRRALAAARPRVRLGLAGAAAALLAALVWGFASPAPPPSPALASIARTSPAVKVSPAAQVNGAAPLAGAPALAIGDSVMLGAADGLIRALGPRTSIDAGVARQPAAIVAELRSLRAARRLPDRVIVQLGNNGPLVGDELGQLRDVLHGVRRVVLVNVHVPRRWQDEVNSRLRAAVKGWPEAALADWNAVSARGGGDVFGRRPPHAARRPALARTIARALSA